MDAYQQAVEYLTANPSEILGSWSRAECLFQFAENSDSPLSVGIDCGCLTMIVDPCEGCVAQTPELTAAIRADKRLPINEMEITVDHLPLMAGWQRRIDKLLNRTPPALDPRLPMPTGDIEIPEPADVLV